MRFAHHLFCYKKYKKIFRCLLTKQMFCVIIKKNSCSDAVGNYAKDCTVTRRKAGRNYKKERKNMIKIYVCSQSVTGEYSPIASDSIDYIKVSFSFSPDWYGLSKTAQFTQNGKTYNVLLDKNTCVLPRELEEGFFDISVFGVLPDGARRITTLPFSIIMKKSAFVADGETPIPPTPDLYSQLVGRVENAIQQIPDKLSEFENDTGFITENGIPKNLSAFSNDMGFITKSDIPQVYVPSNLSEFENDKRYICPDDTGVLNIGASAIDMQAGSLNIGYMPYGFSVGGNRIYRLASPQNPDDACTKGYVDDLVGEIDSALSVLISLQNELIGG